MWSTDTVMAGMLDCGERHARRVLLEEGFEDLSPFYHIAVEGEEPDIVMGCCFNGEEEKAIVIANAKLLASQMNTIAVMFVSECWMSLLSDLNDQGIESPEDDPSRVEAVIMVVTDGHSSQSRALRIGRDPDGTVVSLNLIPSAANITSVFTDGIMNGTIH